MIFPNTRIHMKSTKTQQTYLTLQNRILDSVYVPGSQLRIDLIATDLGVSTGAVREALSRLSSDGLVINPPQRGYEVTPISRQDLIDLTEARVDVETKCLALSLENGDVTWEGQILSCYHILSRTPIKAAAGEGVAVAQAWTTAHDAFHDALVAACPNPWWLKMRRLLYIQAERYRRMAAPIAEQARDITAEHRALMETALRRDVPEVQKLFASHISLTAELLIKSHGLELEMPAADDIGRETGGRARMRAPRGNEERLSQKAT